MPTLNLDVHVKAPCSTVFQYLTDFEHYGEWAEAINDVTRDPEDQSLLSLRFSVAGKQHRHTIRVEPDSTAWTMRWVSTSGPDHAGAVALSEVNPQRCAVQVKIEIHTRGIAGAAGTALGVIRNRIDGDLHRFSRHVERQAGRRPPPEADIRAPSEKLFDRIFPTDETTPEQ